MWFCYTHSSCTMTFRFFKKCGLCLAAAYVNYIFILFFFISYAAYRRLRLISRKIGYSYIVRVSSDVQLIFPSIMIDHKIFPSLTFINFIKVTKLEERKRKIEEYFSTFEVSCQLKQNKL